MFKVASISQGHSNGGANRAAYRIHRAVSNLGVDSTLYTKSSIHSNGKSFLGLSNLERVTNVLKTQFESSIEKCLSGPSSIYPSFGLFDSGLLKIAESDKPDLIQLHWTNNSTASLKQISKVNLPLIWTLHDLWPISRELPYEFDYLNPGPPMAPLERFIKFILLQRSFKLKRAVLSHETVLVGPSRWMVNKIVETGLIERQRVRYIPNCVDTDFWRNENKHFAKAFFGLDNHKITLLIFAAEGANELRKGTDFLFQTFQLLQEQVGDKFQILSIGSSNQILSQTDKVISVSKLQDDLSLKMAYNAADALILPSREDNLPNTVLESMSCATPVIGFSSGGHVDAIINHKTGLLAKSLDAEALSSAISEFLSLGSIARGQLSEKSRKHITENFSYECIGRSYISLFEEIINA